jgi:tetratricopeptide (TPR) repeat protein
MITALLSGGTVAFTQEKHGHTGGEEVGEVHFTISTDRPQTQEDFNRAAALLYSFAYGDALRAFHDLTLRDPSCAMAYWGVAMSYFHPVWEEVPAPNDVKTSLEAIKSAKHVGIRTEREKDYIAAIEQFYSDADNVDYKTRVLNFEKAMEQMTQRYPDDMEAAIFYALALDATALKTDKTYTKQKKAGDILLKIFAQQPNHPGVAHYIIHAYDYPPLAALGLNAARKYSRIAPSVPHALHMPSHIFVRLGLWEDDVQTNIASAKAAQEQARKLDPNISSFDALHAWDYMMYGYLQLAQDKKARRLLETVSGVEKTNRANFAAAYALAAIPARYALERHDWAMAVSLSPHPNFPWDKTPWFEAIIPFARAIGAARTGDAPRAQLDVGKLSTFYKASVAANDSYWANQVDILYKSATAWTLHAQGKNDEALKMMQGTADQEDASDKHPVTPGAPIPQRELLGELLLELNQPKQALTEFETSLASAPNRFNGLAGAARAADLSGDRVKATSYYRKLVELTKTADSDRPALQLAKEFLGSR